MKSALVAVLACTGCDTVFSVDHVDLRDDGRTGDGRTVDADIPTCLGGDEDCDKRLNASDFCPADFDTVADDDADGVGNACDPDPMGPSPNHILFFDGFDNNTGGWTIKSGEWQLGNGVFRQPQIADTRFDKAVSGRYPTLELIITELDTAANGSITGFGVTSGLELRCSVFKRASDGAEFLDIAGDFLQAKQVALPGTGTLRLTGGQRQTGDFYCAARHGTNFDTVVTSGSSPAVMIDTVGVRTSSASVTISSATLFNVP